MGKKAILYTYCNFKMAVILETERLRLRHFTLEDSAFIIELLNSPGWLQFIGDRHVHSTEDAWAYLQNGPLKSYQQNGYGFYMVEEKGAELTPVGMCGITQRDFLQHPDLGFAFLPSFSGKGYAYEIASATVAYVKDGLKISTLSAIVLAENKRSIRLLEKLHFRFETTIRYPGTGEELQLYTATL